MGLGHKAPNDPSNHSYSPDNSFNHTATNIVFGAVVATAALGAIRGVRRFFSPARKELPLPPKKKESIDHTR